jgi:acyl-CoA reductase-like NAD-dependent aldehyde dehydrogenase
MTPIGVVGTVIPEDADLTGFVDSVAPAIAAGNTVVTLAGVQQALVALTFATALAVSGLPPGVVNFIVGHPEETAPVLASHPAVAAVDLLGIQDPEFAEQLAATSMINLKRLRQRHRTAPHPTIGPPTRLSVTQRLDRMASLVKTATMTSSTGL